MLLVHLSGSSQKVNHFQEMLLKSYQLHGAWERCVTVMKESGINVNIFASHSTRSASTTSTCKIFGLSFEEIAKSAGWSNEKTFAQLNDRAIQDDFKLFIWLKFAAFICIYIYNMYMVLIIQETPLIKLRRTLGYILLLHSFPQIPPTGLETNYDRI